MAQQKAVILSSGKTKQIAATDTILPANLATGTPDGTKFLRDDGTWQAAGGGTDFATEYTTTSPAAPATGITPFARKRTGQTLLAVKGLLGSAAEQQPHFGFKRVALLEVNASGTGGNTVMGMPLPTLVGSSSFTSPASTNIKTQVVRQQQFSTTTAGLAASIRSSLANLWRGNAAGLGGFYFSMKFAIPANFAGSLFYAGLTASTSAIAATAAPSSQVNIIGVGQDAGDTTLQIMYNDAAGTATKINTSIAISTAALYCLRVYCAPNQSTVYISFEDIGAGTVFETNTTTDLPANTTFLTWILHIANNATASNCAIEMVQVYSETDN